MIRRHRDMWSLAAPSTTAGLSLLPTPPEWMRDALCAQADPDCFFPDQGGTTRPAKAVCGRCPVRVECLAHALERQEPFGVWGGLSESERRAILRPPGRKTKNCRICSTEFAISPSGNTAAYCSPECRREGKRENSRRYGQRKGDAA